MTQSISEQDNDYNDVAKTIGRTIAKYRLAKGLTQAEVAENLNISNDAVSRMERGGILPSIIRLLQFAELFDCSASELLSQASPNVVDQSKHINQLLYQLNDKERKQLIEIIESMVDWHTGHSTNPSN